MHANRKNWLWSALPFDFKPPIKSVRHESSDRFSTENVVFFAYFFVGKGAQRHFLGFLPVIIFGFYPTIFSGFSFACVLKFTRVLRTMMRWWL